MQTKTICFFNSSKTWGGGEKWHFDNATFMAQKGYTVVAFTNTKSELADELNKEEHIKNIQLNVSNLSFINPFKILHLREILKEINPETILVNLPSDLKLVGFTSLFYNIPNIIYRRGSAIPIKNSLLNRFLFKKIITGIIANSEATKKTILQNNCSLYPKNQIKVIYNGISINEAEESKPANTHDEIILGHLGRFSKEKNQQFLIKVAKELRKQDIPFKMILGGSGPELERISEQVSNEKLSGQILFPGFISNTRNFLNAIDIFLLPSIWEGFGYVTVEAMANKKPVIAFKVGSNPEIVDNEVTGFLIPPFDLNVFVKKIQYLHENRDKISEMGLNGRLRVKKYFDIQNSYTQLESYLINL